MRITEHEKFIHYSKNGLRNFYTQVREKSEGKKRRSGGKNMNKKLHIRRPQTNEVIFINKWSVNRRKKYEKRLPWSAHSIGALYRYFACGKSAASTSFGGKMSK